MGIHISEKRVRRIMKQEELKVYQKKEKKYASYAGEITPAVPNWLCEKISVNSTTVIKNDIVERLEK